MSRDGGERGAWGSWDVIPRVVAGAVSLPVVVGFVALGAAVIVVRSVRDVARDTWARVPPLRTVPRPRDSDSDAA